MLHLGPLAVNMPWPRLVKDDVGGAQVQRLPRRHLGHLLVVRAHLETRLDTSSDVVGGRFQGLRA